MTSILTQGTSHDHFSFSRYSVVVDAGDNSERGILLSCGNQSLLEKKTRVPVVRGRFNGVYRILPS